MANLHGFDLAQATFTVRLVQGYRYLDRCGEALIRLENTLGEGWLTGEIAPKGGSIRNEDLQLSSNFDTEQITVNQTDSPTLDAFRDSACRIAETLLETFGVETINAPVLRLIAQKGAETTDAAESTLRSLRLVDPSPSVRDTLGPEQAIGLTYVSEQDVTWLGFSVPQRRRLAASVVEQFRQRGLDPRLLRRVRLLPSRQQDAVKALFRIQQTMPEVKPHAVQLDVEHSYESEFSVDSFDCAEFLNHSWKWLESALATLSDGKPKT